MKVHPARIVIETFGGVRATARALGRAQSSVSKWQQNGKIPTSMLTAILSVAKERGLPITAEDLVIGREEPDAQGL